MTGRVSRGIEASYYADEKKTNVIPLVTASEEGIGQTESRSEELWGMWCLDRRQLPTCLSRGRLERRGVEGETPVGAKHGHVIGPRVAWVGLLT